jgi:hypothetical protein
MTGYPGQPTATSAGDIETADVMGQAVRRETDDAPAETPPRTDPDQKAAPRTSESMPAAEGIYRPEDYPDAPE